MTAKPSSMFWRMRLGRLGLAGDGLHTVTEDDADADAGADRREAVTDGADVARDGCESLRH